VEINWLTKFLAISKKQVKYIISTIIDGATFKGKLYFRCRIIQTRHISYYV